MASVRHQIIRVGDYVTVDAVGGYDGDCGVVVKVTSGAGTWPTTYDLRMDSDGEVAQFEKHELLKLDDAMEVGR